jgi:antitoxin MazE
MAITRIQKWGNSYGIRIPKNIMDEMGLRPDTRLEIHQEQGKIALTPLHEPKVSLDELLEQITPENLHGEIDWGAPTGNEAW